MKKYDIKTLKKPGRMTKWLLNVNMRTGKFYLNDLIRQDLDLKNGQEVIVASDEEKGTWYICFEAGLNGVKLHNQTNSKGKSPRLCFGSSKPAHILLDKVKATIAATFLVAKTPTMIEGHKWYRIITSTPVRVS